MGDKEIVKEYASGDLTVVWKPKKCIHAGICVKSLPKVYDPKGKPWIKAENASADELMAQIEQCPSGALSYTMENENIVEETSSSEVTVKVMPNGPLLVSGTLQVTDKDGNTETKTKNNAFCRCGGSSNKPYCDGTHSKIEFCD